MEGNYNARFIKSSTTQIIPLREMEGNYNGPAADERADIIIPLREMEGNYNPTQRSMEMQLYYTLERDGRELQHQPHIR